MDESLQVVLRKAEDMLKDKSVHYLVAISDAQNVQYLYDSKVAAKGIVDMICQDIKDDWRQTRPQGE